MFPFMDKPSNVGLSNQKKKERNAVEYFINL